MARNLIIDIEVYNPDEAEIFQQYFEGQYFDAGQTRTYTAVWTVPANAAAGVYTIQTGIFSTSWRQEFHWNDAAARLTISGPP